MFSILKQKAFTVPDDTYIIFEGQEYTFLEIYRNACRVAEYLSENEVNSGDRVGVLLPNSIDYIYLIYALMKLRAILIPMNTRLNPASVIKRINSSSSLKLIEVWV